MRTEIKNVSLSFCCKEDWNSFTSIDERTRFCASCKNKVVDFTNATESDYNRAINSGEKICGRFKQSQLSESFLKMAAASFVVAVSATSIACDENKNVGPQIQQQESCRISETITMGMPVPLDPLQLNSNTLPIIVGNAPQGEEPVRYNPAFPDKGFYKKNRRCYSEPQGGGSAKK
jgi:hypothetical protein